MSKTNCQKEKCEYFTKVNSSGFCLHENARILAPDKKTSFPKNPKVTGIKITWVVCPLNIN
jgi:hypothetical protein